VEYLSEDGHYPVPKGLEKHDVYIIEEAKKEETKEEVVRDKLDKFHIYSDD
jgi:hypothetical protein